MCGFLLAPRSLDARFYDALTSMEYRGADGYRSIEDREGWLLGHVRLAIQTDDSFGDQPFVNGNRTFAFVGEIFGLGLGSEEDAIEHALQSPYLEGFMKFDGFWSVAEIRHGGQVRVLTDHLGIKPVYYWPEHDVFCSELDPMFELLDYRPPFDEIYLSNCIKFGYDYSGRTPYKGVFQVPAGTAMVLEGLTFTERSYWNWNKVETQSLLRDLTLSTVRRAESIKHGNAALLVSGGLDSMIIYGILQRAGLIEDVLIYSIENGESQFLPSGVELLPASGYPSLEEAVGIMQAPLDLGSLLPQIQLARALETQGCRVCLTGDGADELFGGYSRAKDYDSQASDVFCELPYYHLPRLDRVHMRSTTEVRSPFLSPAVVATALRLPRADRIDKRILKETFGHLVPTAVLERAKHPLKGKAYLDSPLLHRTKLVEAFRNVHRLL